MPSLFLHWWWKQRLWKPEMKESAERCCRNPLRYSLSVGFFCFFSQYVMTNPGSSCVVFSNPGSSCAYNSYSILNLTVIVGEPLYVHVSYHVLEDARSCSLCKCVLWLLFVLIYLFFFTHCVHSVLHFILWA